VSTMPDCSRGKTWKALCAAGPTTGLGLEVVRRLQDCSKTRIASFPVGSDQSTVGVVVALGQSRLTRQFVPGPLALRPGARHKAMRDGGRGCDRGLVNAWPLPLCGQGRKGQ